MSKQYTVYLSEQQKFYIYTFVAGSVQPKGRDDARLLQGVFETFGLDKLQSKLESLPEGAKVVANDFDSAVKPIETGSVDLNTLLSYLDKPGANAILALKLLTVSEELLRAKEQKPRALESVPEAVES